MSAIGVALAALGVTSLSQARRAEGHTSIRWSTQPVAAGAFARYHRILGESPRRIATVRFGGHTHSVIIGVTKAGGICLAVTGPYGGTGCPLRTRQGAAPASIVEDQSGPIAVESVVRSSRVARAVIRFSDGRRLESPVLWVSQPVGAGFVFVAVPAANRKPGHRPSSIEFVDANGASLRRGAIGGVR